MKKKSVKWIRDENGAVIVLVALALTVLLGMSALAVDYGSLVVAKSELQNAADAAALAGARALIDGDSMPAAVVAMCADNNCDTADGATVTSAQGTHNGKRTVTVTVTKPVNMSFSQVLTGKNTGSVTATATAETANIFDNYKYTLFATEDITDESTPDGITTTGNNVTIFDDIHSNSKIKLSNKTALLDGATATAVANGTGVHVDMPNIKSLLGALEGPGVKKLTDSQLASLTTGSYSLTQSLMYELVGSGSSVVTLYFQTTKTVNIFNAEFNCPVNIVTDGPIVIQGSATLSSSQPVIIITNSTEGVTLNGSGLDSFYGIIFAPNGDLTLHGGGQGSSTSDLYGSIIAKNITIKGGKFTAHYDEHADDNLPDTKVRLID